MIISIHQPLYLPWLGFFHKAALSDVMVLLDNVQMSKGDFVNRNRIKTKDGSSWLTIPVNKNKGENWQIKDLRSMNQNWVSNHINQIYYSYKKAKYFNVYFYALSEIFQNNSEQNISSLNKILLEYLCSILNIEAKFINASSIGASGTKSQLLLDICQKIEGTQYISGINGKNYLNLEIFRSNSIEVRFQSYKHPTYYQLYGSFLPNLSVLDLIFNYGEDSIEVLMSGNVGNYQKLDSLK